MSHDDQPLNQWDPFDPQNKPDPDAPAASGYAGPAAPQPTAVFCLGCGYNLTGTMIGSTCPECGHIVAPSFHGQTLPSSGKAVASMVLGICAIVGCTLYGVPSLICGPLAIIFAILAQKQVKNGTAGGSSTGMATAGLVCGIIGLVMGQATVGIFVAVIIANGF